MLDRLIEGEPLAVLTLQVEPHRANALGHLAAAQYIALFDEAFMTFIEGTGLTDSALRHGETTPVLKDLHASYLREVKPGDTVAMSAQLLSFTDQRMELRLAMQRAGRGDLVATCRLEIINLGLTTGKPTPWSATQQAALQRLLAAHINASPPHGRS